MTALIEKLRSSPVIARVAPYFIFVALTAFQGKFGAESKYWFYLAKSLVGVWLIWAVWPVVKEMRWTISLEAVFVGILVFVVWVGIDSWYPKLIESDRSWNPHQTFGQGSAMAWLFIVVRIAGSSLVVPPIEEAFFRSFLYRYILKEKFEEVPLKTYHFVPLIITSLLFAFIHREWLAGIFCGIAYQWLVIRRGHLGDAMTAHAITNFLLGAWVVYRGAWQFW